MRVILSLIAVALTGLAHSSVVPYSGLEARQVAQAYTLQQVTTTYTETYTAFQSTIDYINGGCTQEQAITRIQTVYTQTISQTNFAFAGCQCGGAVQSSTLVTSYTKTVTSFSTLLQVAQQRFPNGIQQFQSVFVQYQSFFQQSVTFGQTYQFDVHTIYSGVDQHACETFGLTTVLTSVRGLLSGVGHAVSGVGHAVSGVGHAVSNLLGGDDHDHHDDHHDDHKSGGLLGGLL